MNLNGIILGSPTGDINTQEIKDASRDIKLNFNLNNRIKCIPFTFQGSLNQNIVENNKSCLVKHKKGKYLN